MGPTKLSTIRAVVRRALKMSDTELLAWFNRELEKLGRKPQENQAAMNTLRLIRDALVREANPEPPRTRRFAITGTLDAECVETPESVAGQIFHVERNSAGGATRTPVARFFTWRPEYVEGFHAHWRVDCFVCVHPLAPEPAVAAKALVDALMRESLCSEPLWVSWYCCEEIHGKAYGEVFDLE